MNAEFGSLIYSFLILIFGGAVGAGLQALYRRGFDAGEEGGIKLSKDDRTRIYWLATNGFHRLLMLGEKGLEVFKLDNKQRRRTGHSIDWNITSLKVKSWMPRSIEWANS